MSKVLEVFPFEDISGFPHNGGEHTLSIRTTEADLVAFKQLLEETYGDKVKTFTDKIEEKIMEAFYGVR
jgi:predicted ATPase